MYCTKKITSDLIWLGGSDRRLALFENVYPLSLIHISEPTRPY